MSRGEAALEELRPAFRRLDALLDRARALASQVHGPAADDPLAGARISAADADRLLSRPLGVPLLWDPESPSDDDDRGTMLDWLAGAFDLAPFDLDVILVALAPELDLRYERIFSFLQNDVLRRRPSIDLCLNLLCETPADRLENRARFEAGAPLMRHALVQLSSDGREGDAPLLARAVVLDPQVVRLVLRSDGIDARLSSCANLEETSDASRRGEPETDVERRLAPLLEHAAHAGQPLRVYLHGPRGSGKSSIALSLARRLDKPLLTLSLGRISGSDVETTTRIACREAWFHGALLYVAGVDERNVAAVLRGLDTTTGVAVLAGADPWMGTLYEAGAPLAIPVAPPAYGARRRIWTRHARAASLEVDRSVINELGDRFRLTDAQIAAVVAVASAEVITGADLPHALFAAARAQRRIDLRPSAERIEPSYGWDDIVLPADALAQLTELCERVRHRRIVYDEWGFGATAPHGTGIAALFAGPSGTGKTMAAEVIARELQLDLYRIDLSGVVSKYIGETEKNLDRIFSAAERSDAILCFDEADSVFGKRSEVHDAHDRYANLEISYLLQKMERFDGIAVLTTNLRANLDDAFVRRLTFAVHFPFPDEASRRQIWDRMWPEGLELHDDVDLDELAKRYKLAGGNIKNIALAAAFRAAARKSLIRMQDLLHATRREYQKLGKELVTAEPVVEHAGNGREQV